MTTTQLINALSELPDLRILIYADHGQSAEETYCVQEMVYLGEREVAVPEELDCWDQEEIDKLEKVIVVYS